jgi:hypothetical protein
LIGRGQVIRPGGNTPILPALDQLEGRGRLAL